MIVNLSREDRKLLCSWWQVYAWETSCEMNAESRELFAKIGVQNVPLMVGDPPLRIDDVDEP